MAYKFVLKDSTGTIHVSPTVNEDLTDDEREGVHDTFKHWKTLDYFTMDVIGDFGHVHNWNFNPAHIVAINLREW